MPQRRTPDAPSVHTLLFAKPEQVAKPVPRYWRPPTVLASQVPNISHSCGATDGDRSWSLSADPGRVWKNDGSRWGDSAPVAGGDPRSSSGAAACTPKLRALGAQVNLVRDEL